MLSPISVLINLVDKPGGRKLHSGNVPLIGGLCIYLSVGLIAVLFVESVLFTRIFVVVGGLIVLMGMLDDKYHLSPGYRLVAQLLISCIFVYGLEIHIKSLGAIFEWGEIQLGILGYPVAVLSLMGVSNAMNMMDGVDGLVGGISIVSFLGMLFLFGLSGAKVDYLICTSFIGALFAFLYFNLVAIGASTKKIFMGDAGSMFLGLSIGVFCIRGSQGEGASFPPVVALWLVFLPFLDMVTIIYRRLVRGSSPLSPDRTHLHHILLRAGYSPREVLCIILIVHALLVTFSIILLMLGVSEMVSLVALLLAGVIYQVFMSRLWFFFRLHKARRRAHA
ncbi:undecaprenyl/decaprenyl-phosphate alpha-N-acetylglucosaminyl 1-phosphate transferase [Teredinibacter sp. KSP-S5-2]|uniref:undecaprenyl/decaprenyl-phosphate alpha-N-acetylglucosaminyl 1-phosphate transferase n=1 Tax=Teredinibacter sp. KSP-S5-2 TaxID=3034506 RepID=UPI002934EC1D|nr:undecaprenyl/decaprenyl-phosphate alpha-N-acetylglucosaminyl 1-phosphate transferase [Teredinibacter sp. KSP-S5-2]WNO07866.1 undecaprenyl/decaprenyl-phosphate alpha-N-acetylglucosaminyl 1-phosphate transferase [Teredinibacter sp. KSP-S5-2]